MTLLEKAGKMLNGMEVIRDWLGEGAITVSPEQAQERADICASCSMNVHGGVVSESIAQAIKRQVELKNHLNLHTKNEEKLGKCSACLCETKLKIWLPLRNILPEPEERENFDSKCWLLNETPNE